MFKKLLGLLSDAAIYGASSLIGKLINLLLVPLLTRRLVPEEMGVVGMLAILPSIFLPLANLGMTNAIFRRFHQEKDEAGRQRILSTGLTSVLFSSVLLAVVSVALTTSIATVLLGNSDYN